MVPGLGPLRDATSVTHLIDDVAMIRDRVASAQAPIPSAAVSGATSPEYHWLAASEAIGESCRVVCEQTRLGEDLVRGQVEQAEIFVRTLQRQAGAI